MFGRALQYKMPRLEELNSHSPVGEMAKKLSEAQEYEVLFNIVIIHL